MRGENTCRNFPWGCAPWNFLIPTLSRAKLFGSERQREDSFRLLDSTLRPKARCAGASRLNMDQDVIDFRHAVSHCILDAMCNFVRFTDGHLRIHLNMHVHEVLVPHLARDALFNALNTS